MTGGERFVKFEVFGCIMSSTARRQGDRGSHRAYGRATSPYNNESSKEKMLRVCSLANSVIILVKLLLHFCLNVKVWQTSD